MKINPLNLFIFLLLFSLYGELNLIDAAEPPHKRRIPHPFSVMQGASSANFTSINILGEAPLSIEIREKDTGKALRAREIKLSRISLKDNPRHSLKLSTQSAQKFHKELLRAEIKTQINKTYILKITNNKASDLREFSSFNHLDGDLKVAIASCLNDKFEKEQKIAAKSIYKLKPDYIFLIGDNVYADSENLSPETSPEELERRYIVTREKLALFHSPRLIPILMIWDDHDYGKNNGNKNYKYKEQSLKIFKNFTLNENPEISKSSYGAAFQLKLRGNHFFFLDNRFFRDDKYHFGKAQETWLFENINKNPILISGDQFFGSYHPFESFSREHPENFKNFINHLERKNIQALFISGDRHLSEVQLIPSNKFNFIEITSSPLHSYLAHNLKQKNPHRIKALEGIYNFCIIDFKTSYEPSELKSQNKYLKSNYIVRFYNLDGDLIYAWDLSKPLAKNSSATKLNIVPN